MDEKRPSNFSNESKEEKEKPLPAFVPKAPSPQPNIPQSKPQLSKEEIDQLFKKIQEYHDLVEKRLEQAMSLTNMSREQITRYLNNPSNFSPQQWNSIQNLRKNYESLLDRALQLKKNSDVEKKKQLSKEDKQRKGKTLGGRRKWLSM